MRRISFLSAAFFLIANLAVAQEHETVNEVITDSVRFSSVAQLQALNKTTAKTSTLDIKVGQEVDFGSIAITALKCWQAPLDQRPESKILVSVSEIKKEDEKVEKNRIFYGWLFASSPSLSGIEHPIYDIVAVGCKSK